MNILAALAAYCLIVAAFLLSACSTVVVRHDGHTYKRIHSATTLPNGSTTVEQWARVPVLEGDPIYMRTLSGDFVRLGQHRVSSR
jgi:hypothetical protein